jgi:hypothetical protein
MPCAYSSVSCVVPGASTAPTSFFKFVPPSFPPLSTLPLSSPLLSLSCTLCNPAQHHRSTLQRLHYCFPDPFPLRYCLAALTAMQRTQLSTIIYRAHHFTSHAILSRFLHTAQPQPLLDSVFTRSCIVGLYSVPFTPLSACMTSRSCIWTVFT